MIRRAALAAGLAAVLVVGCSPEAPTSSELVQRGAHLLLISIDTLRADRLGCYGYGRGLTPRLDELAADSVLFEEMYSNSPKTASSHMSLFTSLLPSTHKVRNQSNRLGLQSPTLADNRLTLTQVLNRAGYWTAAVAAGGNLRGDMGFAKGFGPRFESGLADVSLLVDRAIQRLRELRATGEPGFLFFHTYQVHGPYLPPAEYMQRYAPEPRSQVGPRVTAYAALPFNAQWQAMNHGVGGSPPFWEGKEQFGPEEAAYLSDLYDGEIAYTDEQVGRLLDALRRTGLYDDTLIVLLSDHGEEFFEHGDFEHDQLYREHLHVPCLVKLPGSHLAGTRVTGLASLIDVMPTLLELLGLEGPPTMIGTSLVGSMLSGRTPGRPVVAERVMFPEDYKATLRSGELSVMFHAADGRLQAFDLVADPGEQQDVAAARGGARSPAAEQLRRALASAFHDRDVLDRVDAGGIVTLSDEAQLAELTGLGYVGGADQGGAVAAPSGTPLDNWPTIEEP